MRVILIDPAKQAVYVKDQSTDLKSLQEAVGGRIEYAHDFENGDHLIVNEEGLLEHMDAVRGKLPAEKAFLFDVGAHQPFAGKGIIVGRDDSQGYPTDAVSSVEDIMEIIQFLVPRAFDTNDGNIH